MVSYEDIYTKLKCIKCEKIIDSPSFCGLGMKMRCDKCNFEQPINLAQRKYILEDADIEEKLNYIVKRIDRIDCVTPTNNFIDEKEYLELEEEKERERKFQEWLKKYNEEDEEDE